MLWFVGLGTSGADSLGARAARLIYEAHTVYVDTYTSPGRPEIQTSGHLVEAPRWMVEDGQQILKDAVDHDTVLVSCGDPMVATTHTELRVRAASQGIPTGVIHAASALTDAVSECGLHHYKVGRTATVMDDAASLTTPYYTTYRNMVQQCHTMLLLEYNQDRDFFLDPAAALQMLAQCEASERHGVFTDGTYVMVASRIGWPEQRVVAGRMHSMIQEQFGSPPHSIIVPGRLHFTERDAVDALVECVDEPPPEDTDPVTPIPNTMVTKYSPMIQNAIDEQPVSMQAGISDIVQNARNYMQDAQKALDDGQPELAVLLIGYADGLVDSLRIMRGEDRNC